MSTKTSILFAAVLSTATSVYAQSSVLETNLIVNGNAETGPAGMDVKTAVASIPGWTVTGGKPTVLPYNLTGFVQLTDPDPPDHGFQYFAAVFPSLPATLSQNIDVSGAASLINAGTVKFTASAYLGSVGGVSQGTSMAVAFKNASGQTFSTTTVGPLSFPFAGDTTGMFFQQQIGLVPAGTVTITVTLTLQDGNYDTGVADSLSLVLTQVSTTPMLGVNLVVNGGAEAGTAVAPPKATTSVPGWSTTGNAGSVAPYGGSGWVSSSDPGPADRGVNVFWGWLDGAVLYQDIDVSGTSSLIDSGQVTYQVGAWLGAVDVANYAGLSYTFFDWSGKQLAPTAQLNPVRGPAIGLVETSQSGPLPSGTRRVRVTLNFPADYSVADDINFTLAAPPGPPVIFSSGGLGIDSASAFGGFAAIAPGTWIEIYGSFLTSSPLRNNCGGGIQGSCWAGSDFNNGVGPTSLDGVSVSVNGKAAYIDYTSPTQVNALVPSNAGTGPSAITLTNANGTSESFPIYINQTQPGLLAPPGSFVINNKQYVAGILPDGSFALPTNAIPGVASRPANPGEIVVFYGIGFGPTLPNFTAGTVVTAQNELATPIQFLFNTTSVTPAYWGLALTYTGLYQFNVVVPNIGANNALPLSFTLGGVKGTQTLYIAVN